MNKNKSSRGQQNDTPESNANREPIEDRGDNAGNRGNAGGPERGAGRQGEKNSGGISNRGMNRSDEQADLPSRGSSEEVRDSSSDEDLGNQSER